MNRHSIESKGKIMDRFLLRALKVFKTVGGFLPTLCVLLAPVFTVTGVQGAEIIGKSAARVETVQGSLEGVWVDGSEVYRGIPYAKPPVEDFRWQPPQPVAAWSGVRPAKTFGPACPQPERFNYMIPSNQAPSEDCLTINVSAPAGAKDQPVWVMIHGGGFASGSGEYLLGLGPLLNAEGIVFVSFNYRLSTLGFFAHPELAGELGVNFGLMDMWAALEWVRENIAAFGGDPDRITVSGISAGGMAVDMLMVTPESAKLIAGAISQSGYGTWFRQPRTRKVTPLDDAPSAEAMASELAGEVTGKPPEEVTKADLYAVPAEHWAEAVRGFHVPIVDGLSLPEESAILFARGMQHPVPFMSGGTSFDGSVLGISGVDAETLVEITNDQEDRLKVLWAADFRVNEAQGFSRFFGDARYVYAALNLTQAMQTVKRPGYLYYFDYVLPEKRSQVPGAEHGSAGEIMWTQMDLPVAQAMRGYWIDFVKTGNPNGGGRAVWPPAAGFDEPQWIVFGEEVDQRGGLMSEKMQFIDELWQKRTEPLRFSSNNP